MKNTNDCVTIHIVNSQKSDGVTNRTEFTADCEFYEKDGFFYVTYTENADMGTGESRVFVKVKNDSVTIRRMGEFKSVMQYEEGRITDVLYQVPFGKIDMKIKTICINNGFSEKGGALKMNYNLIIGDEITQNDLLLEIKKERKI